MFSVKRVVSKFRKIYEGKFLFRCFVLIATAALLIAVPEQFEVMHGWNFFKEFSLFHILWAIWIYDMLLQLFPSRKYLPLGSSKFSLKDFIPHEIKNIRNLENLLAYIKKCNKDTIKIGIVWFLLTAAIGAVYFTGLIDSKILLLLSVAFYVCDLICVLFWCPFRVWFMKNRCCTTCRIFNWDHMMMFSPIVFVPGFFTWSLCAGALIVLAVWEVSFALHPERFYEGTNEALRCSNCTDRLCGERRNCAADIPSIENIRKGI
ncbi:MAG: hypothetical protein IKL57_04075 [Oscillospiraceae bacterium]|nr:hypothetical protein [Oscillospiraceae bacterium]